MARVVSTCALIFIASVGLHQGVTADRPKMTPGGGEFTIDEGDELRIECEGEGLKFSMQQLPSSAEHSECSEIFDEDSLKSTLICPKATRQDTGWYACAKKDIEIVNTEQIVNHTSEDISWIYVYVDSWHPFAIDDATYETIYMLVGSDAVIPCRPTSSDVPVELVIGNEVTPVRENVLYDPKIGFILKNIRFEDNGQNYMCQVHQTGETGNTYTADVIGQNALQNVFIVNDRLKHVVWGEDLTIECRVTVDEGTRFNLDWKTPNSVPRSRLRRTERRLIPTHNSRKEIWNTFLTVTNAEESDGGEYICVASITELNIKLTASENIEFSDPAKTYVSVKVDNDTYSVTQPKGRVARWRILIDTYPRNFTSKWSKSDGREIKPTKEDGPSKYSFVKYGMEYIFRISRLVVDDSDNYTLTVSVSDDDSRTIVLPLLVEARPETIIRETEPSYVKGKFAIFFCHTEGSPLPNLTWSYIEHPDGSAEKNPEDGVLSNIDGEIEEDGPFRLVSRLNLTINKKGDLKCTSCNKFDCSENIVSIDANDPPGEFHLSGPESVAEGDENVRLTCRASRLNFTGHITWKFLNSDGIQESIPEGMRIFNDPMNLTWVSVLEISNVSMSDAGIYMCQVECKTTGIKTANWTLNVLEAYPPRITKTDLNDTRIVIKRLKNQTLTLNCEADGMPIPNVTWYKDNKLLMENNQYEFLNENFTLCIRFFYEVDCGKYSCRAENRLARVEHFVEIDFEDRIGSQGNMIWIILICILILIIVIVITYMAIKVRREKRLRKELLDAGLTHFAEGALECLNPDLTVDEQAELLPYDKKWEFPRELLKLGRQLGSGAFGVVMKAEARGICDEGETTTVAVKMVRRSADPSYMKALSSELKIMIHLGRHLNVVNLLGACTKNVLTKRELYVIVEYCRFGNLHNYLQRHRDHFIDQINPSTQKIDPSIGLERLEGRQSAGGQSRSKFTVFPFSPSSSSNTSGSSNDIQLVDYRQGPDSGDVSMFPDGGILSNNSVQPGWRSNYRGDYKDQNLKPICTQDLLCWAWQIARGMEYLSARNVLHGDLAARNILLADDNIVKICDFGLAKNMYKDNNYQKKGEGPLPIKWMAIESIRDRIFSTQSDVWAFGIVLWEFFTLARTPYPGMEAEKLYDKLLEGYRMEKPEYATKEIYDFIVNCWHAKPSDRPSFTELVEQIGDLLNERIKMHHIDLNAPYMNMNNEALQNGGSDYLTMMSAPNHGYYNSPKPVGVEMHPDSSYVSMNRLKKSAQSEIVSPSSAASPTEGTHFVFPPNQNVLVKPDAEHCNESDRMPKIRNARSKPINVQQVRNDFIRHGGNRNPADEKETGYHNIPRNPHYLNLGNRSSVIPNNFSPNTNGIKSPNDNAKALSPAATSAYESRINKINLLKDRVAESVSNPSYALMSGEMLKEDRK